ncbi:MAG: alkaline phosphatase family protein [Sulfuricurvum sp.]
MRAIAAFFLAASLASAAELQNRIEHIVVVYLENRSFDNLFRGFEGADTSDRPFRTYAPQADENGTPFIRLEMGEKGREAGFSASVPNAPFLLDETVSKEGIIPDLIHRYYQNIFQIDGGKNDRFAQISDGKGLVMGYHDMHESVLWKYAREFTLCDRFFAGAFGGSFLNHQWLIAARTPFVGEGSKISRYELDANEKVIRDGILTPDGYAVNTIQPFYPPYNSKYSDPALRLPPLAYDTIGDALSSAGITWAWYSGGYDAATRGRGGEVDYQYHHNPFLYFERYAPGTPGRAHLKDENDFLDDIRNGNLPQVAFFKPSAHDNQHPGYASVSAADEKLKTIVESIRVRKELWEKSVIIVTYDENGGLWDHVPPPVVDRWGPGTRIPALIISPMAKKGFIDHTFYDTVSILRFIEWRYALPRTGDRESANLVGTLRTH